MKALELIDVCKTYKNGVRAVDHINLSIEPGDFYALLGPNGAGKSTTIGMITTVVTKTSGVIRIMDHDIDTAPSQAKAMLGAMPQEVNLNIFETPWQILFGQAAYFGISARQTKSRVEYLLKQVDLWEKRHAKVRQLSGGMKRRLMIARALVHNPKVLILDEPTAGVDVELRNATWEFLQQENRQGLTIILTTHYLEEAEKLCNKIAIINHGKIVVNDHMKTILKNLDNEVVLLKLQNPCEHLPDVGVKLSLYDKDIIEATLKKEHDLTELLLALKQHQIIVSRVMPVRSQLEHVFVGLLDKLGGDRYAS